MAMRCIVVPAAQFGAFDVWLIPGIWRVSPVPIYAGPHAGDFAINAKIHECAPEFERSQSSNVEEIKQCIRKKEKGEPVTGPWAGIQLSEIPAVHLQNPE